MSGELWEGSLEFLREFILSPGSVLNDLDGDSVENFSGRKSVFLLPNRFPIPPTFSLFAIFFSTCALISTASLAFLSAI